MYTNNKLSYFSFAYRNMVHWYIDLHLHLYNFKILFIYNDYIIVEYIVVECRDIVRLLGTCIL